MSYLVEPNQVIHGEKLSKYSVSPKKVYVLLGVQKYSFLKRFYRKKWSIPYILYKL